MDDLNTPQLIAILNQTISAVDKMEEVVKIVNENWLITHDYLKLLNSQKDVQALMGRYKIAGVDIDYVIGGHIHYTNVSDLMGRSASMAGSNEYNEKGLNLAGRASQNIYIVDKYSRHRIAIDLQNTVGNAGYDVIKELEEYNAKSTSKLRTPIVIHQVTI